MLTAAETIYLLYITRIFDQVDSCCNSYQTASAFITLTVYKSAVSVLLRILSYASRALQYHRHVSSLFVVHLYHPRMHGRF